MIIQWYGQACFKIQSGDFVMAIDPYGKEIGLTPPRFRANVVLVTHNHHDHNNADTIAGEPFLITGPGEYEVKGAYVSGIETFHDKSQGRERGMNTIYKISLEDITIVHLGDFGEGVLRDETVDAIGNTDVLMMPVGGVYTIDAEEAARVVKQIEPRIVIPMHYNIDGLAVKLGGVGAFLKEVGASGTIAQEKFTIKKKDLSDDAKTRIVVLKTG